MLPKLGDVGRTLHTNLLCGSPKCPPARTNMPPSENFTCTADWSWPEPARLPIDATRLVSSTCCTSLNYFICVMLWYIVLYIDGISITNLLWVDCCFLLDFAVSMFEILWYVVLYMYGIFITDCIFLLAFAMSRFEMQRCIIFVYVWHLYDMTCLYFTGVSFLWFLLLVLIILYWNLHASLNLQKTALHFWFRFLSYVLDALHTKSMMCTCIVRYACSLLLLCRHERIINDETRRTNYL